MAQPTATNRAGEGSRWIHWQSGSLALALVGLTGSLYLSVGMGLKACPLCFYQRSFVMAVAAVLGVGLASRTRPVSALSLLSLPLAASGLGVAAFHVYLELTGKLECPVGVMNLGTAPQQSLAIFVLLLGALLMGTASGREPQQFRWSHVVGAALLGLALAAASIWSTPPLPTAPAQPYDEPLLICRPPFIPT
jgi:disulfide bond formation protein DsbB